LKKTFGVCETESKVPKLYDKLFDERTSISNVHRVLDLKVGKFSLFQTIEK